MDTLRRRSAIEKIHADGMVAVIDGDNMKIVDKIWPNQVNQKLAELEKFYADVGEDADGDIVFYLDID